MSSEAFFAIPASSHTTSHHFKMQSHSQKQPHGLEVKTVSKGQSQRGSFSHNYLTPRQVYKHVEF